MNPLQSTSPFSYHEKRTVPGVGYQPPLSISRPPSLFPICSHCLIYSISANLNSNLSPSLFLSFPLQLFFLYYLIALSASIHSIAAWEVCLLYKTPLPILPSSSTVRDLDLVAVNVMQRFLMSSASVNDDL